jgi:hypothetical protein
MRPFQIRRLAKRGEEMLTVARVSSSPVREVFR